MAALPAPSRALEALGLRVEEAAARLDADERAALELRESGGAGYAAIAEAVGRPPDDVAALLTDARLSLWAGLRGADAPEPATAECERARPLLTARQDGELTDTARAAWLRAHAEGCDSCRTTRLAMREASIAFRGATRASAAPAPVVLGSNRRGHSPSDPAQVAAAASVARTTPPATPAPATRRVGAVLATVLGVVAAGFAVLSLAGGGEEGQRTAAPAEPTATAPAAATAEAGSSKTDTAAERRAAAERRRRAAARRRRAAAERRRRAADAVTPQPAPTRSPEDSKKPADAEKRKSGEDDRDKKAKARKRSTPVPSGDAETETNTQGGAGLNNSPQPGSTPGGVTDVCNEESPDCESG